MGRAGFFVAIIGAVIGLCLMAWRLSAVVEAREAAASAAGGAASAAELVSGEPVEQATRAAAMAHVQQAAIVAESYAAENGTYAGISTETLHVLDTTLDASVVVAYADDSGYCVQAGSGATAVHSAGPAGPPADGACA